MEENRQLHIIIPVIAELRRAEQRRTGYRNILENQTIRRDQNHRHNKEGMDHESASTHDIKVTCVANTSDHSHNAIFHTHVPHTSAFSNSEMFAHHCTTPTSLQHNSVGTVVNHAVFFNV